MNRILLAAVLALATAARADDPPFARVAGFELNETQRLSASNALTFSPDGRYLSCGWTLVHVPAAQVWGTFDGEVKGGRRIAAAGVAGTARATFAPDSKSVVLNSPKELAAFRLPAAEQAKAVIPPNKPNALAGHALKVCDPAALPENLAKCDALAYLPDGKRAVTTNANMVVLRDAKTGEVLAEADAGIEHALPVPCLGGTHVFVWRPDQPSTPHVLWDLKRVRAEKLPGSDERDGSSVAVSLSADGQTLVEVVYRSPTTGELRVWDLKAKTVQKVASKVAPSSAAFLPDGSSVAIGYADGAVEVWDRKADKRTAVVPSAGRAAESLIVDGLAVSADGKSLAAYSRTGVLTLYRRGGTDAADITHDWFPTAAGTTWLYRTDGKGKKVVKVVSAGWVVEGNERVVRLDTLTPLAAATPVVVWERVSASEFFTVTKAGVALRKVKWADANAHGETVYTPAVTVLPAEPKDGGKWEVESQTGTKEDPVAVTAAFRQRAEEVDLPGGKFNTFLTETARFAVGRKSGESAEAREYWFAKGVGRVKWAEGRAVERELVEFRPAPKGKPADPVGLTAQSVWAGDVGGISATLFVTDASNGKVSGELWIGGQGKLAFTGTADGAAASLETTVKEGAGLQPATNSGKVDGDTFAGTWRGKKGGDGKFSFKLVQR